MKAFFKKHGKGIKLIGLTTLLFLFWLFPYLAYNGVINYKVAEIVENIAIISIGLGAGLALAIKKDCHTVFTLVSFTPFVFAHAFDARTIPVALFIALGLLFVGFVVSWIRFRPKLHIGPFFFGLLILGLALILGGLGTGQLYFSQLLFVVPVVAGFLVIFVYFISLSTVSFKDLSWIFFCLSIYLVLQCLVYYLIQPDILEGILEKGIDVGWGISNNIATILLLLIPFSMYLAINYKGYKSTLILAAVVGFMVMLLFTYSRGGLLALGIIIIPMFIYCEVKAKGKLRFALSTIGLLILVVGGFGISYLIEPKYINTFFHNLITGLDTMERRIEIYKYFLEEVRHNVFFGYGLFAPFEHHIGEDGGYQWGHGTIIHTIYTMGIVGFLALMYHLGEKYFMLFKKHSLATIITAFAFIGSGLYGLIDVSYYFINYMILLIIILAVVSKEYIHEGDKS